MADSGAPKFDVHDLFHIVTASQTFICRALPLTYRHSPVPLQDFVRVLSRADDTPVAFTAALIARVVRSFDSTNVSSWLTLRCRYRNWLRAPQSMVYRFRVCTEEHIAQHGATDTRISLTVKILLDSYANPALRVRDVATAVGLSPSGLSHLLASHTGMSFRRHLRLIRLHRAAALLTDPARRIKEAWAAAGYKHASDFDHHFRAYFGLSPRAFRAQSPVKANPELHSVPLETGLGASAMIADSRADVDDSPRTLTGVTPLPTGGPIVTILLVDPNSCVRESCAMQLQSYGCCVRTATNWSEGDVLLDTFRPQCIISELHFPSEGDLARLFRLSQSYSEGSIVVFTADWFPGSIAADLSDRGATIAFKPLSPAELLDLATGRRSGR